MPSKTNELALGAEQEFREAFERLKAQKPVRLPTSALVSQNNVAKEADRDPSALRKSRYPRLIAEIQTWVAEHGDDKPQSPRQKVMAQRTKNKSLREQLKATKTIRDVALSKLIDAEAQIVDLTMEVARLHEQLPPSNVVQMHGRSSPANLSSPVDLPPSPSRTPPLRS